MVIFCKGLDVTAAIMAPFAGINTCTFSFVLACPTLCILTVLFNEIK